MQADRFVYRIHNTLCYCTLFFLGAPPIFHRKSGDRLRLTPSFVADSKAESLKFGASVVSVQMEWICSCE